LREEKDISGRLLHALLITQISKNDYTDFQGFLDFFRNLRKGEGDGARAVEDTTQSVASRARCSFG
jgi:hypothetical protein